MKKRNHVDFDVGFRWYAGPVIMPMPVTIITTLDSEGALNAAPYSLVSMYDAADPKLSVQIMDPWHTGQNIAQMKEFVVNFPSYDCLDGMMETARFHDKGVNELDYTKFSTIPAQKVKPPRIVECYQHLECVLEKEFKPSSESGATVYVGKILAGSIDEEIMGAEGLDKMKIADPIVYLGETKIFKNFTYGRLSEFESRKLKK